jgi:hypothetical protein
MTRYTKFKKQSLEASPWKSESVTVKRKPSSNLALISRSSKLAKRPRKLKVSSSDTFLLISITRYPLQLCFSCRQPNHTLQQCPNVEHHQSDRCYHCGSTQHRIKDCHVPHQRGKRFLILKRNDGG